MKIIIIETIIIEIIIIKKIKGEKNENTRP